MNAHEKGKAAQEARERCERCRDWLKTLMLPGHAKPATKDELYALAKEKLGVNRSNFDTGWDWAIWMIPPASEIGEITPIRQEGRDRHDWIDRAVC